MSVKLAADRDPEFNDNVREVFQLFTTPRMEFHSRGETGFWDTTDSHQFGEFFVSQFKKNLIYMATTHFPSQSDEAVTLIENVLGNYMSGKEELTVTFYYKRMAPMGMEVSNEFEDGRKIATLARKRQEGGAISEPDKDMFDWLYGVYTQNRTDDYNEGPDYALTLSIRNTKDYVDFSASGGDYESQVRTWVPNESRIQKLLG